MGELRFKLKQVVCLQSPHDESLPRTASLVKIFRRPWAAERNQPEYSDHWGLFQTYLHNNANMSFAFFFFTFIFSWVFSRIFQNQCDIVTYWMQKQIWDTNCLLLSQISHRFETVRQCHLLNFVFKYSYFSLKMSLKLTSKTGWLLFLNEVIHILSLLFLTYQQM